MAYIPTDRPGASMHVQLCLSYMDTNHHYTQLTVRSMHVCVKLQSSAIKTHSKFNEKVTAPRSKVHEMIKTI